MISWPEFKFSPRQIVSPNGLSVLRALMALTLPFFVFSGSRALYIAAGFVFGIAALTDYWDGIWARKLNLVSDSGKIVDPTADKFLILVPLAAFVHLKIISVWWVVPIFLREIVITFCRIGFYMEGAAVGAEKLGKIKFVSQTALIIFAYFYFISFYFSVLSGLTSFLQKGMIFCLVLSVALTLISGWTFIQVNRSKFKPPFFAKYVSAMGVGLIPFVPGTLGSAVGLLIAWMTHFNWFIYILTMIALLGIGYWSVNRLDLSANKDPGFVVVDETIGMMLTLVAMPLDFNCYIAGFFLFRLFDVIKPYPCRQWERLPGYWGILCDDLGAGVYAWLILAYLFL